MTSTTEKILSILMRAQGATQTAQAVGQVDSSISKLTSRAGKFATTLKTSVGGALTHFGGRLKEVASVGLGALGVGGIFGIGAVFEKSLGKAQEWGLQIEKLTGITRDSAEQMSGLLAVTEKFGLSSERLAQIAGFTEKSLGAIASKASGAAKFQKLYGFAIVDGKGKVKDFNTVLLQFSDYWNKKGIPASTKAAAAAKLFGRGYADLVPILNLGQKGIKAAEEEAAALGLTLTKDNVVALSKAREATRKWGDAIGGLELQIGIALLPALTDLATAATSFVQTHGKQIIQFFKDAVQFGRNAAGVIGGLASAAIGFWNSIPAGLRDMLVKGIVADRTVNFLFGISPIKVVASLAESALGGIGKTLGGSITQTLLGGVQKVFVVNPGFGGGGGGAVGAAEEGAAAAGGISLAGLVASAAVLVGSLVVTQKAVVEPGLQSQAGQNVSATEALIGRGNAGEIGTALRGLQDNVASLSGLQKVLYDLNADGVKVHTESLEAALSAALADAGRKNLQELPAGITNKLKGKFDTLRDKLESTRIATVTRLGDAKRAIDIARIDQVAATRTGDSAIVAAIRGISLAVNLTVPITVPGGFTRTVTTKSGTTLVRIGGNGARGAIIGMTG